MATNVRNRRLRAVVQANTPRSPMGAGVVLTVTTGEVNEGQVLESQIDAVVALRSAVAHA